MTTKDLTQFLVPDLVIRLGDNTYTVKPPSRDAGIRMAALVAMGNAAFYASNAQCPTCGRTGAVEVPQETRDLLEPIKDQPLGVLTLGREVFEQMEADGVPEAHQDRVAQYALYYWVLGEQAADATFEATYGGGEGESGPKDRRPSKSGQRTGSGSRTRTGSTRGTGSRRN